MINLGELRWILVCCGWLAAAFCTGCITINVGGDTSREMEETVIYGDQGPKVLLIDIDGEITSADASGVLGWVMEEGTLGRVRDQLEKADAEGDIEAILLRIDSPGGSAAASDAVYQQIMHFKAQHAVPVTAQFLGTAASGGYLVAMAGDEIVATRTSVTGSIGVVLFGLNLSGLMDKLGIEDQTFTSGDFKDAGSMLRPMTESEIAQMQSVVDDLYAQFVEVVDAGRPALTSEQVRALADGRIYSAQQALAAGLIDRIGTLDETIDGIRQQLGAEEVRVVAYHRGRESPTNIYSRASASAQAPIETGSAPISRIMPRPGFHYIWLPGVE